MTPTPEELATPTLVITLGDPLGVGVEITYHALVKLKPWSAVRTVIVGSRTAWDHDLESLKLTELPLAWSAAASESNKPGLHFVDVGGQKIPKHLTTQERGALAIKSLEWVNLLCNAKRLAVVTAPIDKFACHEAGFVFPGQTEFFEKIWQGDAVMTLAGPKLRVGLVTNHLPLKDVPGALTESLITSKIRLFKHTLTTTFGIKNPIIGVTGLNPHAGDQGLFGSEETNIIAPAIERAKTALGLHETLIGPLPADTAFYQGYIGKLHGVLAMYHDQGLGPLKTVHFDNAINVSGGLKHLRVSPDHGPAKDLYLKGQAASESMELALKSALTYLSRG